MLQIPDVTAFIASYRALVRHKRICDSDDLMFRYFPWGVRLMSMGIVIALLVAILDKFMRF